MMRLRGRLWKTQGRRRPRQGGVLQLFFRTCAGLGLERPAAAVATVELVNDRAFVAVADAAAIRADLDRQILRFDVRLGMLGLQLADLLRIGRLHLGIGDFLADFGLDLCHLASPPERAVRRHSSPAPNATDLSKYNVRPTLPCAIRCSLTRGPPVVYFTPAPSFFALWASCRSEVLSSNSVMSGYAPKSSAQRPDTVGVAKLVPDSVV